MFSFFKSNKNKQTSVKSTYYIRECLIHNVSDLLSVLNPKIEDNAVIGESNSEVKLKNLSLIGLTQKEIIAEMDHPVYIFDNSETIKGHKVMFYKEDVEFYRFLIQFHFIDDNFFFASNKVTSSGMLTNTDKEKIVKQLANKYLSNTDINDNYLLSLTDSNNSILSTVDDVYYYVNYLSGAEIKNKLIKRLSANTDMGNKDPDFDDTINKYF